MVALEVQEGKEVVAEVGKVDYPCTRYNLCPKCHLLSCPCTCDDMDNRTSFLHIGTNFGMPLGSIASPLVVEAVVVQVLVDPEDWAE
jgi:hypothetical protein